MKNTPKAFSRFRITGHAPISIGLMWFVCAVASMPARAEQALNLPDNIVSATVISIQPAYYYSRLDEVALSDRGCQILAVDSNDLAELNKIISTVDVNGPPVTQKRRLDLRRLIKIRLKNGDEVEIGMERGIKDVSGSAGYMESGRSSATTVPVVIPAATQAMLDQWARLVLSEKHDQPKQLPACQFLTAAR